MDSNHRLPTYQVGDLPLIYTSMAGVLGIEPRILESKSSVIPFHHTPTYMVPPPGIEPGSMILQTIAMTTSAKAAC